MLRRVHISQLRLGELELDDSSTRHLRDVLRLKEPDEVEVFDDEGAVARATIVRTTPRVVVKVESITRGDMNVDLTIASAIPKGERADWMIEKLSEIGCNRFIPLSAARSVVLPEGKNKLERWSRIAAESAKQSRRRGVMKIDPLKSVTEAMKRSADDKLMTIVLSTGPDATPLPQIRAGSAILFIGPEGGWTDDELTTFSKAGATFARLTDTVLRIETAAIVAGAVRLISSNPTPQI